MASRGFIVRATFSSYPLYRSRLNDPNWRLKEIRKDIKKPPGFGKTIGRSKNEKTIRNKVKVYCFEYVKKQTDV